MLPLLFITVDPDPEEDIVSVEIYGVFARESLTFKNAGSSMAPRMMVFTRRSVSGGTGVTRIIMPVVLSTLLMIAYPTRLLLRGHGLDKRKAGRTAAATSRP
jgi:hypothetical protein